jgi:hypothetical protein
LTHPPTLVAFHVSHDVRHGQCDRHTAQQQPSPSERVREGRHQSSYDATWRADGIREALRPVGGAGASWDVPRCLSVIAHFQEILRFSALLVSRHFGRLSCSFPPFCLHCIFFSPIPGQLLSSCCCSLDTELLVPLGLFLSSHPLAPLPLPDLAHLKPKKEEMPAKTQRIPKTQSDNQNTLESTSAICERSCWNREEDGGSDFL